ncbi:MAG TPA: acylphosphatase [Desulfobulbus sp.]|nr:acylphosphatase [Desulfobulbus sp.]
MARKRMHAIVHGRVQGVMFRAYTQWQAETLGLDGWVRNLPDGTVETVFEGEEQQVEAMCDWLRTGSPRSRVSRVDCEEEPAGGMESGFSILF